MSGTTVQVQSRKLLDHLAEQRLIAPSEIVPLSRAMSAAGASPPDYLVRNEILDKHLVLEHWARVLGVEAYALSADTIDPEATHDVPESVARELGVIPVARRPNALVVCMADPLDLVAIDRIRFLTGLEVMPVVALRTDIDQAIASHYAVNATMREVFRDAKREREIDLGLSDLSEADSALLDESVSGTDEAPVVRIVNLLLNQAMKDRASDIHIEPDEPVGRVRFRIDGVLHERAAPPRELMPGIVTRIKVLSRMDIAERRTPQDGQFVIQHQGHSVDFRVSTLPTVLGEKVVIRVLDKRSVQMGLDACGMEEAQLLRWRELIKGSGGILLVTGPTGSGKTTTLYASLNEINNMERNIVTVEDPVEYKLPVIQQVQVNPRASLTFASGLRAILRQDPDVIMVGEVRDSETAEIAVRAALTGHMVLSTLHTNEAAATVVRLTDMGLPAFLVASSVRGVLAQRLVRRICAHCKVEVQPDPLLLDTVLRHGEERGPFYVGAGCRHCQGTGYLGRSAVYELMTMSENLRRLMLSNADSVSLRTLAIEDGMRSLRRVAVDRARAGLTTLEEVARVALVES